MTVYSFSAIVAQQSPRHTIISFSAKTDAVHAIARVDRIGRATTGALRGFQRPQIAKHIREIADYLQQDDAILPNPIVLAFTDGVTLREEKNGAFFLDIDAGNGPPGFVVDGQQRLAALSSLGPGKDFELLVSAILCEDENELRRQFVLVNNTRPLPKSLIYELLPTVDGLPERLAKRALAALITELANHDDRSILCGEIYQHTNPDGRIKDVAIQKVVMNSMSDGVMGQFFRDASREEALEQCVLLLDAFFRAVAEVFPEAWAADRTPRTSRLVHGAGIVAMGYVMETLTGLDNARTPEEFATGLKCLVGRTAWTDGEWNFGPEDRRHWRAVQNVNRDVMLLADHLIGIVRADLRNRGRIEW